MAKNGLDPYANTEYIFCQATPVGGGTSAEFSHSVKDDTGATRRIVCLRRVTEL